MRDGAMRDPGALGARHPRRLGPVADDEDDFGRVGRVGGSVDQRLQVRSAARNQNAHLEPWLEPCHGASASLAGMRCSPGRTPGPLSMASPRKLRYHRVCGRGAANITGSGPSCNEFAMTLPVMPAGAGRQSGWRFAGAALLVALVPGVLALGLTSLGVRAQEPDPLSATVAVDATADTVVKAREMARIDGQRRALAAVAERLAGGTTTAKPPKLDDKAITDLVLSFEVAN